MTLVTRNIIKKMKEITRIIKEIIINVCSSYYSNLPFVFTNSTYLCVLRKIRFFLYFICIGDNAAGVKRRDIAG